MENKYIRLSEFWTADVHILLHAEFSAMDYTLNIVSKCRFFVIFKHSRALKRFWIIFHGVLESAGFFVSKRVGTLVSLRVVMHGSDGLYCFCPKFFLYNSWTAALSLMKFCTNMYLDNCSKPREFQGHRLKVKVIFFVSRPKFTTLFSLNVEKS